MNKTQNLESYTLKVGGIESVRDVNAPNISRVTTESATAARQAAVTATAFLELLDAFASDGVLAPTEKKTLRARWYELYAEYPEIKARAVANGVPVDNSFYVAYVAAYDALYAYLYTSPGIFNDMESNSTVVPSELRAAFSAYFSAREQLLTKLSTTSFVGTLSGGVFAIAWSPLGVSPDPASSPEFSVVLTVDGAAVTPTAYSWVASGQLSGTGAAATFTPTIVNPGLAALSLTEVYCDVTYGGVVTRVKRAIAVSKLAVGLEWIADWDGRKVKTTTDLGVEYLMAGGIYAGSVVEDLPSYPGKYRVDEGVFMGRGRVSGIDGVFAGLIAINDSVVTFKLNAVTGAAEFAGELKSPTGVFGGWTIGSSDFSATNIALTSGAANAANISVGSGSNVAGLNSAAAAGDIAFWAGSSHANRATAPFRVKADGSVETTKIKAALQSCKITDITAGNTYLIKGDTGPESKSWINDGSGWKVIKSLQIGATGTVNIHYEGANSFVGGGGIRLLRQGSVIHTAMIDYSYQSPTYLAFDWANERVTAGDIFTVEVYVATYSKTYAKNFTIKCNEEPGILSYIGTSNDTGILAPVSAQNITQDDSSDATRYILFADGYSGVTPIKADSGLSYNPSSGLMSLGALTTIGDLIVGGNLAVNGTVTTINSTELTVDDKNITLGSVATPTDTTADGGGITLKGATDKTIIWDSANANWTLNQNVNIPTGLAYKINNVSVLNATTLGSSVVNSSLTSVGTLASLAVSDLSTFASTSTGKVTIGNTAGAGEGGTINIVSNGGLNFWLENADGTFRGLNSGWTEAIFSIDQTGNFSARGNVNIATGQEYKINGTSVLSATTLGSVVTGSSLTSVGTLTGLVIRNNTAPQLTIGHESSPEYALTLGHNGIFNLKASGSNYYRFQNDGVTAFAIDSSGNITAGVWNASAITDTYLATISTAGKVANSATTATSENISSAIVARNANGDFDAHSVALTASIDVGTALYIRGTNGIQFLNKAANGWLSFATRDTSGAEAVYNLANVGHIYTSSFVSTYGGRLVLRDDSIENWSTASDSAGIAINYGTNGLDKFRDFTVFNGKGAVIALFDGSASTTEFRGLVSNLKGVVGEFEGFRVYNNDASAGNSAAITLYAYDQPVKLAAVRVGTDAGVDFVLSSNNSSGNLTERLRLTEDGLLGIGRAPSYTVDAEGVIRGYDFMFRDGMTTNGLNNQTALGAVYGKDILQDLLAFNAPNTFEIYNGATWDSYTVPTDCFIGDQGHNFYSSLAIPSGTTQFRLTWNTFGYKFWDALVISCDCSGNVFTVTLQYSDDGNTWVDFATTGTVSNWPGYAVYKNTANNSGHTTYFRMLFTCVWNNSYQINIGNISLMGSYGGYAPLYTWDYEKRTHFYNEIFSHRWGVVDQYAKLASDAYAGVHLSSQDGYFRFDKIGGEATPYVSIIDGGNVGIGTTSPNRILTISNTDTSTTGMAVARTSVIRLNNPNSNIGTFTGIQFGANTGAPDAQVFGAIGTVLSSNSNAWAGDLVFGLKSANTATDLTEYMRIVYGGNVGIGTTSPTERLSVANNAVFYDSSARIKIWNAQTDPTIGMSIGLWDGATNRLESFGRQLYFTSYSGGISFGISGDKHLTMGTDGSLTPNSFTSGSLGTGWKLDYNATVASKSYLEIDNIRVRDTLFASVFQKDIIRVSNGQFYFTDGGIIAAIDGTYVYFDPDKSATFASGQRLEVKDIAIATGIGITSVKLDLTSGPTTVDGLARYTYTLVSGAIADIAVGSTAARISGGNLLADAVTANSPFLDVRYDYLTKARLGNLSGITSPTFGTLAGWGLWSDNIYLEGNANILGTLAVGGGSTVGNTFYVGKIQKNLIKLSESADGWSFNSGTCTNESTDTPVGVTGNVLQTVGTTGWGPYRIDVVLPSGYTGSITFSAWIRQTAGSPLSYVKCFFYDDNSHITHSYTPTLTSSWVRYSWTFDNVIITNPATSMLAGLGIDANITVQYWGLQWELGSTATPYQKTDATLSSSTGYGMWATAGGFGGTMQNPVVALGDYGMKVLGAGTAAALSANSIMIGNITGSANSAIKLTNTGTQGTSGLFGYTSAGAESFALRLDGTAQIGGWSFDNSSLAATGMSLNSGTYPFIAFWDQSNGTDYITIGRRLYDGAWHDDYNGMIFRANSQNWFQMYSSGDGATRVAQIAGWNFDGTKIYSSAIVNDIVPRVLLGNSVIQPVSTIDLGQNIGLNIYKRYDDNIYYNISVGKGLITTGSDWFTPTGTGPSAVRDTNRVGIQFINWGNSIGDRVVFEVSQDTTVKNGADGAGWKGLIAGWKFNYTQLYSSNLSGTSDGTDVTSAGIVISSAGYIAAPKFLLKADGSALFKGTLSAPDGNIGGWTIGAADLYSGGIHLVSNATAASNKIYIGTGAYNNANTAFYVDGSGQFSLKDKLTWDGTTLTVNGGGTFSGNLSAAGGTFTGALSGGTISIGSGEAIFKADSNGIYLGSATFADAEFSVTPAGLLKAISGSVAGFSIDGTEGLYAGTDATRVQMKAGAGFWAGATARADAPFSVTEAGALKAVSGVIGPWTISSTSLSTGAFDTVDKMYFGASGLSLSNVFKVTAAGALTAKSGTVGGWSVAADSISIANKARLYATGVLSLGSGNGYKTAECLYLDGEHSKVSFGAKLYYEGDALTVASASISSCSISSCSIANVTAGNNIIKYIPMGISNTAGSPSESYHVCYWSFDGGTGTRRVKYRLPCAGTVRVNFTLKTIDGSKTVYGRIYKNDAASGAEHSTTSTSGESFYDDISVSEGDLLELYIKQPSYGALWEGATNFWLSVAEVPGILKYLSYE